MYLIDREITSWSFNDGISTDKPNDSEQDKRAKLLALKIAVKTWNIAKVLILYTDKSVQYASDKLVYVLDSNKKIICNRSGKGNCWDNAISYSFF